MSHKNNNTIGRGNFLTPIYRNDRGGHLHHPLKTFPTSPPYFSFSSKRGYKFSTINQRGRIYTESLHFFLHTYVCVRRLVNACKKAIAENKKKRSNCDEKERESVSIVNKLFASLRCLFFANGISICRIYTYIYTTTHVHTYIQHTHTRAHA